MNNVLHYKALHLITHTKIYYLYLKSIGWALIGYYMEEGLALIEIIVVESFMSSEGTYRQT